MKAIILTAGKAERLKPVINSGEKILLPIFGQPVGIKIVLQYINLGIQDFLIVTSEENRTIIVNTLDSFFCNSKIKLTYHTQAVANGPGEALKECTAYIDEPVIVHLSDTVCKLDKLESGNWIGVSVVDNNFNQWCMVSVDEHMEITDFYDKPNRTVNTNLAAIGLYCFEDYKILKQALCECSFASELSTIFNYFMKHKKIKAFKCQGWQDLGSMPNYINHIRYQTADCRCFNKLTTTEFGTCIKKSSHKKTLNCEKNWYKQVEKTLEIERLVPQIYRYFEDGYEMEFFDYPSLSYIFLYHNVCDANWLWMMEHLLDVLKKSLWKIEPPQDVLNESYNMAYHIYGEKLRKRLDMWGNECVKYEEIEINDKKYNGLPFYEGFLKSKIDYLSKTAYKYMSVIHGDLVFSNILYSTRYGFFKLIDARGNFGTNTIFGDKRYDFAKLRQCYHGLYDLIVNDSFEIVEDQNKFWFTVFSDKKIVYQKIDKMIIEQGVDIKEIEWIECLLFLSMIPLHSDKPKRQMAFYLKAMVILNQIYTDTMEQA